jgi:hypothetical protein
VAEVVIDGLKAVEIEAKHGKALPARHSLQRLLQLFLEQGAVGELGQRIMAGEMDDLLFLPVSFDDVLVQRHPTATLEGLARDGDDAGIGQLDHHRCCGGRLAAAQRRRFAHLTARAMLAPMVPVGAVDGAGQRQFARQPIHLCVTRIAHEQAILRVEHAKSQRHVVDGNVELQVEPFQLGLLVQQLDLARRPPRSGAKRDRRAPSRATARAGRARRYLPGRPGFGRRPPVPWLRAWPHR